MYITFRSLELLFGSQKTPRAPGFGEGLARRYKTQRIKCGSQIA
jgi:hypothetical protein